jgi:high affinity sulfate transporter 1
MRAARYVPITSWLRHYKRLWFRMDAIAGVTLWAVLVPEAMAYAGIAGVSPVMGLYTVPLPLIAYALFGSSRSMVVGTDSATALVSAATVGTLVVSGSAEYAALTSALAILVGLLFLLFGFLRLGWVADFISRPVMQGFITGVVLVTIIGQVPTLIGLTPHRSRFFGEVWNVIIGLGNIHPATVAIGLASLLLLVLLRRYAKRVPAALTTVGLAIIATAIFDLERHGVSTVGAIPTGFPRLALPPVGAGAYGTLLSGALAVVLLGYAETLGCANTASAQTGEIADPNQELLALGAANVGSGLSGGFVAVGSFSKTGVALASGVKSQLAYLVSAGLVIGTLLFLTPAFTHLPDAALAAVVIEAMLALSNPEYFKRLARVSRSEFLIALVAMLGVLVLGVLPGIGAGVALDLLLLIRGASRPRVAVLGKTSGHVYQDISLHPEGATVPGLLVFRFEAPLIFTNAGYFVEEVQRLVAEQESQSVLVDAEGINGLDSTAAERLLELHRDLHRRGIELSFARVRDPIREVMRASGVLEAVGSDRVYGSITSGIKAHKKTEH